MGQKPINLAVRFVLEILALIAIGYWGWANNTGALRYILTIGTPLLMAVLWGTLRVPYESPSGHAPIPVPGLVHLLLEMAVFGFAIWGLFNSWATCLPMYLVARCWFITLFPMIESGDW